MDDWPSITVITLTRGRQQLLRRCIDSVRAQEYDGQIQHLIMIDGCQGTLDYLSLQLDLAGLVRWHFIPRSATVVGGPSHLAELRNVAVNVSSTTCVSFLDDDNTVKSNHFSSLATCLLENGYPAVHSYENLFWPDGRPYLERAIPWCRDPQLARTQYDELCAKGVFIPGSNISRDRADPKGHPNPARTVDMGEWLMLRSLLIEYPFTVEYSMSDWRDITTEDDKLLDTLINNEVPIGCTGLPTLNYYLGGFTSRHLFGDGRDDYWLMPCDP